MKSVFSFSLFGNEDKYCKGLLKNITIIEEKFPGWEVWVYCGDGIPEDILLELHDHSCVRLIPTNEQGLVNKFYRFFAIDNAEVQTCIVRDADSRIYDRDYGCIQDFLNSDKAVHIIRDHPNHHHRMMAGMWGCKKSMLHLLPYPMFISFVQWRQSKISNEFWSDTQFLCDLVYPYVWQHSLIHDETQQFESPELKKLFPYPRVDEHFIGQVYEFNRHGEEYTKFTYNT